MRSIALLDAKDTLSDLVAEAERGESIVITEDGRPVATLAPPPSDNRHARALAAIADIKLWREQNPSVRLSPQEVLASIREGRR